MTQFKLFDMPMKSFGKMGELFFFKASTGAILMAMPGKDLAKVSLEKSPNITLDEASKDEYLEAFNKANTKDWFSKLLSEAFKPLIDEV